MASFSMHAIVQAPARARPSDRFMGADSKSRGRARARTRCPHPVARCAREGHESKARAEHANGPFPAKARGPTAAFYRVASLLAGAGARPF